MAVFAGFTLAWILTRTNVPGKALLERLLEIPFYLTPLVGALAWSILAAPKSGFLNQIWGSLTDGPTFLDIYTPFGIAWVMALFEGTVAFVMISAVMKSMDPSLEESSRVTGAGKLRTLVKVTLPLVLPGLLGAGGSLETLLSSLLLAPPSACNVLSRCAISCASNAIFFK